MYMHCFVDAINAFNLQDSAVDIIRMVCDVLVIHWAHNFDLDALTRAIESMHGEVANELESSATDLAFLKSQHDSLYEALHGPDGTGLTVVAEVKTIIRSVFSFTLRSREDKCARFLKDAALHGEGPIHSSAQTEFSEGINPRLLYANLVPSKALPIVELKYKGRVINKLFSRTLTSVMRAVGRIDKQMKTAMLAYPAILLGQGVQYTKVIFPVESQFCHAVIEGYGKGCDQAFFDRYASMVRQILNKHLSGISLNGYRLKASSRKLRIRGLEGTQLHLFCDAVVTTECIRDVLYIRELNRVLEQSVTLFMELKYPMEKRVAATISLRTSNNIMSECTLMVKGSTESYYHVLEYVERLFAILSGVVTVYTTDMYANFENTAEEVSTSGRQGGPSESVQPTSQEQGASVSDLGRRRKPKSKRLITALTERAPDLFATGYARDCQSERQPLIIEERETKEWRDKKILYKGEMIPRSVVQMDVDSGKILLVCPNNDIPFPYFKTNVNVNSKHKYSQIPCCQKSGNYDIPRKFRYKFKSLAEEQGPSQEETEQKVTFRGNSKKRCIARSVGVPPSTQIPAPLATSSKRTRNIVDYRESGGIAESESESDTDEPSAESEEEEEEDQYDLSTKSDQSEDVEEASRDESEVPLEGLSAANSDVGPGKRATFKCKNDNRFLRHKHISILPPILCKVLDLRHPAFDMSYAKKANSESILNKFKVRMTSKEEKGAMFSTKGGFHTQHSTAVECLLMATSDVEYARSLNKCNFVHNLRKKLSKIPNLSVLVSQEIWGVTDNIEDEPMMVMDRCEESGSEGTRSLPRGGEESEAVPDPHKTKFKSDLDGQGYRVDAKRSIVVHSLTDGELRKLVADPNVEFDMDILYRILEEYFKKNIYVISMLTDALFEVPRHRFDHAGLTESVSCFTRV